jgi:hypothetical protein
MNSAKKFVDTLTPEDRVAVIAIPGPGELVDFTTDHDKVREALLRIVGAADPVRSRFNISITEAMAIYLHSDAQLALEVIARECGAVALSEIERCEREVEQDAAEIINDVRHRTENSVHAMRNVLQSLASMEGPKSVILLSEGLIFEGLGAETEELALIAADSRATLDVLLLDVPQFDATCRSPASNSSRARRAGSSIASTPPPISRSIASRDRSTGITCSASKPSPRIATGAAIASASRPDGAASRSSRAAASCRRSPPRRPRPKTPSAARCDRRCRSTICR